MKLEVSFNSQADEELGLKFEVEVELSDIYKIIISQSIHDLCADQQRLMNNSTWEIYGTFIIFKQDIIIYSCPDQLINYVLK